MAAAPARDAAATEVLEGNPQLAPGVELIGEYQGPGFKEPPHIARREDGQVIQLTQLLFLVAEAADGNRDAAAIAQQVTERYGRTVSADNVAFLLEEKLRPLGILLGADGSAPPQPKARALLALRMRRPFMSERLVQRIARALRPLYWPPVMLALIGALAAFDAWLFLSHGVAGGVRSTLYDPLLLLGLFGAIIVATAFHEIGHATACAYGDAKPGVIGAGVYIVWPAFYCDVTDAYRLNRPGRLRTDLGGVYFNGLFALACGAVFLVTRYEPLLLIVVTMHLIVVQQLMPLLRFDGYYVMSDLTGVPDILARIKPILLSLVPGRAPHRCVTELKSWVRTVVTTYIVVLVPVLAIMVLSMVMGAPRMMATAWDSLGLQLDRIGAAHGVPAITLGVMQLLALALPALAVIVNLGRTSRRFGGGMVRWGTSSAPRGAVALTGTAALAAFLAWTWWPNGDYQPIRPGEKGTLTAAVAAVPAIPSGRPSFTPEHAARFDRVPTERQTKTPDRSRRRAPVAPAPAGSRSTRPQDSSGNGSSGSSPAPSGTPEPTATPATGTAPSTSAPAATATPEPTATPTPTVTPEATATATPSG
jgi:putative peptide zinc metalloprotease protein